MRSSETSLSVNESRTSVESDGGGASLVGLRILIVEDNPFIAMAVEEMLSEQGLVIGGVANTLEGALRFIKAAPYDLALLDVNIGERKIDPVAEALTLLGTPFVFTTGCGRAGLPEAFRDRPVVEKPFYFEEILQSLRDARTHSGSPRE
ncbi:response regulator [Methylocystis heyeri]|uniref:Response regulator n=1 Tax=Methylocystis heyeri TaxID=391905 RepID=A0A6B8KE24_9HYPH|nr:response regulator [Methylocystis heyeri]QGM44808.1 response regulator [Methylocystis heyeri]